MPSARVVVLVRDGCHLCSDAVTAVEAVCGDLGVSWRTLDIDEDAELRAAYTDHVPVTMVDGNVLSYWFLDASALRAALSVTPPILGTQT